MRAEQEVFKKGAPIKRCYLYKDKLVRRQPYGYHYL